MNLERIKTLWLGGAVFFFMLCIALVGTGLALAAVLSFVSDLIGWDGSAAAWWAAFTVPLWGPLVTGYALQALPSAMVKRLW